MSKANLRKAMLPVVMIFFDDHSVSFEGESKPYKFVAVGVLTKETEGGYVLDHWVQLGLAQEDGQAEHDRVSSYIAKVKGLRVQTIAHVKVK